MRGNGKIRLSKDGLELLYRVHDQNITRLFIREGEKSVCFYGDGEFWLLLEKDGKTTLIRSGECGAQIRKIAADSFKICFDHALFTADAVYKIKDGVFYKTLTVMAKTPFLLKRIATESFSTPLKLKRGGEGQPVFAGGEMFIGAEFPSACNGFAGDQLDIVQHPYMRLEKGGAFDSFDIVFGFCGTSPERSFEDHIRKHALRKTKPLKIYSDWGLHDELSDNIRLNDKMVKDMIGRIKDLKQKDRVNFDYYLMDAFWWEDGKAYLDFKKSEWPDGISGVTEKLSDAGLKFGLWFDANMALVKLSESESSLRGGGGFCIADKRTVGLLKKALLYHIKNTGIKMIKFDFAYFDCDDPGHRFHACGGTASKEPAIRNFVEMIKDLKAAEPDLKILCYNGFTTDLSWIGSVVKDRAGYAVSPWWAYHADYVYCGDPRASEIPSEQLQKSVIYYTDAMIKQMRDALLPFDFIDDSGTMCANTGTIYYLGRSPLRDSWIMNLSRGSRKLHFYGDLGLLDDSDRAFMQKAEKIFDKISGKRFRTEFILSDPASGEPYGYGTSDGAEGIITAVNPSDFEKTVNICLDEWADGRIVKIKTWYSDGEIRTVPEYADITRVFQTKLGPQSVTSFKWTADSVRCGRHLRIEVPANGAITVPVPDKTKAVSVSFQDTDGSPLRTLTGVPDGVRLEYGTDYLKPAAEWKPWSGLSWTVLERTDKQGDTVCAIINESGKNVVVLWKERS